MEELRRRVVEAESEIERLYLTIEVVGVVDLDTALLNRNGVLEAMERGRRWMNRRGDIYGLLLIRFPSLRPLNVREEGDREIVKHLAAVIAAGLRDVDEVGRTDTQTFAAVLADLKPGAIDTVVSRVTNQLETVLSNSEESGGIYRIAGVEVLNSTHTAGVVLESVERLLDRIPDNQTSINRI